MNAHSHHAERRDDDRDSIEIRVDHSEPSGSRPCVAANDDACDGPMRDPRTLEGAVLAGRFRLERMVARGGFGAVFQATQLSLGRTVAVKVATPPREFDATMVAHFHRDFEREPRLVAPLRHPHIAQVIDTGRDRLPRGQRVVWMALEWLDGGTLRDELRARRGRGGRSVAEAMEVFRPVLDALVYAHDEGVIHRDLKPANIMWCLGARGSTLKVLDFGTGKALERDDANAPVGDAMTTRAVLAYTRAYAAAEQLAGYKTRKATDVHALGLILTELLVDEAPYGRDEDAMAKTALSPVRPTPAAFGRDVGAALEAVLVKALALSPGDRYPDARAFRDALDAALAHPSVVEAAAEPREVSAADGASRASVTATPAPEDPARSSGGAPSTGRVLIAQVALVVVLVAALVGLLRGRPSEPPRFEARALGGPAPSRPDASVARDERTDARARADGTFNDAAHPDVIREAATTRRLARPVRIVRRDASSEPADGERAPTPVTPTTPDAGAGETRPDTTTAPVQEPIADAGRATSDFGNAPSPEE